MEVSLLILAAVGFSLFLAFILLHLSRFLTFFFFICYSLPFLPLIMSMFGFDSEFWTDDTFSFTSSSIQVHGLTLTWIVSTLGMLFALLFARKKLNGDVSMRSTSQANYSIETYQSNPLIVLVFPLLVIAVVSRFFFSEAIELIFPGMDPLICFTLIFCWAIVISNGNRNSYIYLAAVSIGYMVSQLISGDRDFFTLIFALGLLSMVRSSLKFGKLLQIGLLGLVIVVSGVVVSMVRMDVELSTEQLMLFLRFNSWNAIILPVLSLIEAEWSSGPLLYGKTYFDLLLSAMPSPVYYVLDMPKPINIDNPADWFYIEGLGGIHVSGVALRNFGLIGVFLQALLFTFVLISTESMILRRTNFARLFFFLLIAAAIMHTVWYGLIYLINALVFYFGMIFLMHIFKSISFKVHKYGPNWNEG